MTDATNKIDQIAIFDFPNPARAPTISYDAKVIKVDKTFGELHNVQLVFGIKNHPIDSFNDGSVSLTGAKKSAVFKDALCAQLNSLTKTTQFVSSKVTFENCKIFFDSAQKSVIMDLAIYVPISDPSMKEFKADFKRTELTMPVETKTKTVETKAETKVETKVEPGIGGFIKTSPDGSMSIVPTVQSSDIFFGLGLGSQKPTYEELEKQIVILRNKNLVYLSKEIAPDMPKKQPFATFVYNPSDDTTSRYTSTMSVKLSEDWFPAIVSSGGGTIVPKGSGISMVTDTNAKTMFFRNREVLAKETFTNVQVTKAANKVALQMLETFEGKKFMEGSSAVLMEISNGEQSPSLWARVLTHRSVLEAIEEIVKDDSLKTLVFFVIQPVTTSKTLEIRYQRQPMSCLREKYVVVA